MVFSAGSIRDLVYSGISPFPNSVSGVLFQVVNNAILTVENFTGDSLGTTSIADRYQPAVTHLATADVLKLMAVQDNGVQFVTIGDESVNNTNLKDMANMYSEMGLMDMKTLAKPIKFFKARG